MYITYSRGTWLFWRQLDSQEISAFLHKARGLTPRAQGGRKGRGERGGVGVGGGRVVGTYILIKILMDVDRRSGFMGILTHPESGPTANRRLNSHQDPGE